MTVSPLSTLLEFSLPALTATKVGTWEFDVGTGSLRCDSMMAALYGLTGLEGQRGVPIAKVTAAIHIEDRERGIAKRVRMSQEGGLFVTEYRTTPSPGDVRWVLVRGRYEPDEHGGGMRGRGIVIDITGLKQDGYAEGFAHFVTGLTGHDRSAAIGGAAALDRALEGGTRFEGRNHLLRLLSPTCWADIEPRMDRVAMPLGMVICSPDEPIEHVYFPEDGVCSVLTRASEGNEVEIGLYGSEGFGPANVALGTQQAPQRMLVQIQGHGYRIRAQHLAEAMERLPALRELLVLYTHAFAIQAAFTALAHATYPIDKRLARLLLMCHDRVGGSDIALTHDLLASMLAVRRPGVTVALHVLEGENLIESHRGLVIIRDRQALERFAGDGYGKPEAEYRRLFGDLA